MNKENNNQNNTTSSVESVLGKELERERKRSRDQANEIQKLIWEKYQLNQIIFNIKGCGSCKFNSLRSANPEACETCATPEDQYSNWEHDGSEEQ